MAEFIALAKMVWNAIFIDCSSLVPTLKGCMQLPTVIATGVGGDEKL